MSTKITTTTITENKKEFGPELYDSRYKYGYNWGVYYNISLEILRLMKPLAKDEKIIDIGCGMGWFTDMMYFNISKDLKGIDFSLQAIGFHGKRLYPALDLEIANIYDYNYKGYQVATLIEVLEHLDNDIELLQKLDTGTKVFCTVPNEKERLDFSHVREYTIDTVYQRYGQVLDIKKTQIFESFIIFWGIKK